MRFNILPFEHPADLERSYPQVLAKHVPTGQLRTLSAEADPDCPFLPGMLGFEEVGSAYANPLKSVSSEPGRLAQWLQSATAEVWVKFLLALVGLGLAFASALFSTASRDAGHLWSTVILASTSLVLATLVGIVTVPYLARRVAVERLRESFDYDVTRGGIVYALVALPRSIRATICSTSWSRLCWRRSWFPESSPPGCCAGWNLTFVCPSTFSRAGP